MKTPGTLMIEWRTRESLSQAEAAALVLIDQSTWARLELNQFDPRVSVAGRIAKVTKGAVPMSAWPTLRGSKKSGKAA